MVRAEVKSDDEVDPRKIFVFVELPVSCIDRKRFARSQEQIQIRYHQLLLSGSSKHAGAEAPFHHRIMDLHRPSYMSVEVFR